MFNKPRYTNSKEAGKAKLQAIPNGSLHFILHYLLLQKKWRSKLPSYQWHSLKAKPYRINYKHSRAVSRIKDTALCLLNTKYAIKPKNPV
jgi:hypothetical protein